jgi:hypothetical protein
VDPIVLRDQIDRILHSRSFANKSQLRKLLEILFKNVDSQSLLKPDLVIQELWPAETRTKRAADVATEMNRLRHALEVYYEDEGKTDSIRIVLPNRATPGRDGRHEKRWIVAKSRNGSEVGTVGDLAERNDEPRGRTNVRSRLKIIAAIAVACILGVVAYLSIRVLTVHDQPKFGRLDASTLAIFNAGGKELWRKAFPEGFSTDWYYGQGLATRIWFGDLEGNRRTDVLFLYLPPASSQSHSSTLICYSDRGKEKWRWTPGRALPELEGSPATFRTVALRVLKATAKRPPRIVVSSIHDTWWPSYVAILDFNGQTVSEYWHSGALNYIVLADLDGNGEEEIVATGISIGYHQATLVVLDPERVFGASAEAARPDFQIHGLGVAQERLRLLFPRSDLNKAMFSFNMANEPTIEHGSIRLTVAESVIPPGCLIWYDLNKSLHLIKAYAGDEFRSTHARFYQNGKDAHPLSAEEQAAFWKVRCLVGCKGEFLATREP